MRSSKILRLLAFDDVNKLGYTVVYGDGSEERIYVCQLLKITGLSHDIQTGETLVEITKFDQTIETKFKTDLTNIESKNIIRLLLSHGVFISDNNADDMVEYLMRAIARFRTTNKVSLTHTCLGWNDLFGKRAYFAGKSINTSIQSTRKDDKRPTIGERGSESVYFSMILKEVIPSRPLQLALTLGFVAPMVPILTQICNCDVIMTNFAGYTSTGKSTCLALMASLWGDCTISPAGVRKSFLGTRNALIHSLNGLNGFPALFDDYESAEGGEFGMGGLIYALAAGTEKARLNKDSDNIAEARWSTYIGLSGETSIFKRIGARKGGLEARLIEFEDVSWTSSATNAETIMSTIQSNYGFLGPRFIAALSDVSDDDIISTYTRIQNEFMSKLGSSSGLSSRRASKIAVILTTAYYVRKLLDLDIDLQWMSTFLIDNEREVLAEHTNNDEVLEKILAYHETHSGNFINTSQHSEDYVRPNKIVGKEYAYKDGFYRIAILKNIVEDEILRGYRDQRAIFAGLKDNGTLIPDSDGKHFAPKVVLSSGTRVRCYVFQYPCELRQEDSLRTDEAKVKPCNDNNVQAEADIFVDNYDDSDEIAAIFSDGKDRATI